MSSGFVTETELAEAKKNRQEEWEKVRKADEPLEVPDEPYESRSLYDRLKEQKMKKDLEYDEAHKLKNLIRGLDDDEIQFLDLVDQNKLEAEKKQQLEEAKELKDFRERVATLQEKSMENKLQNEMPKSKKPSVQSTRPSQKSLVGAVVRKRKADDIPHSNGVKIDNNSTSTDSSTTECETSTKALQNSPIKTNSFDNGAFKCIGVLPGIGRYRESSDSEMSTDSEEEAYEVDKYDLCGRKKIRKCEMEE